MNLATAETATNFRRGLVGIFGLAHIFCQAQAGKVVWL